MATVDLQVNMLAKVLFVLTASTALAMVALPFVQRSTAYGIAMPDLSQQLLQALLDFTRFMLLFRFPVRLS